MFRASIIHALWFGLARNREVLYERINLRVDLMFEQGLVDEVRGLMDQGLGDALTSMQAIGYKEIIDAFNGVTSMDEARELLRCVASLCQTSAFVV